jgi:mannose-6-phosphate isomerase
VPLYPLLLEPIYKEKVWGGRALEQFGRLLPGGPETLIGESWELADLDATSPSGGGGAAAHSRILNGPLAKRTLGEVVRDFSALVTGRLHLAPDDGFPLLLKYLDARRNLSVQVHPSPEYAAANPAVHLKSEAWYVVDAEPDAVIYKGVVEGTTPERFEAAIRDGTVVDLLIRVPARAGECHYLPSGTCHALGGGVLVAEVQTPSDTTFRVYDWGRTDRELHIASALECIDFGPLHTRAFEPGTTTQGDGLVARSLVRCEHFTIGEWTMQPGSRRSFVSGAPAVLMPIEGDTAIEWGGEDRRELRVSPGQTVLLPAALVQADIVARTGITLLEVAFPEEVDEA